jgi:hypothetical protein
MNSNVKPTVAKAPTNTKPIPHPLEEVMKDLLKVKPQDKASKKPKPAKKSD